MPLSDGFLTPQQLEQPLETFPLALAFCPQCALVQITETVPPEKLFCDDYAYYASFSTSWLAHCRKNALELIDERALGPQSLVVELASNDGYMLRNFVEQGIPVLGIDPAEGPVAEAAKLGVTSLCRFFSRALAEELRAEGRRADLVIANNVLAHATDTNDFVAGIAALLKDEGVAVIEVPYLVDLIEKLAYDTIYHEHLCYFSVTALDHLFARHGLHLNRVDRLQSHGGSLRLRVGLRDARDDSVRDLLRLEAELAVDAQAYYEGFAERARAHRDEVARILAGLKAEGATLAVYGAAAKGTILLNFAGITAETIAFAVDRNVHKHGKFIPGTGIPIHPPERVLAEQPDVLVILPWNLRREIVAQEAEYQARGGKFFVPLPRPEVIQ
jgi:SAM-dependent methyltransferase